MVIDQGTLLDRIDYNVERVNRDVKEADKELKVASGYQQRSIKRKIMLLLAILIAGVFILLSLKLGRKGSGSPAPVEPQVPDVPPAVDIQSRSQPRNARVLGSWHRRKRRIRHVVNDLPIF